MAPKKSRNIKTKAKRVFKSSFELVEVFDQTRFHVFQNFQKFDTLLKYRSIWGERQVILDELDPSIRRNLESKGWLPLCHDLIPPLATLVREFYLNLSIQSDSSSGHILTAWIRGEELKITKQIISEAFGMPLVCRPTYPCTKSLHIDDVMTLLYGRSITWGTEPRLKSCELKEYNYMLFRIACYNLFPISHVHTIPIDRCVFLYALSTDGPICFPSSFIQTIVAIHWSKSRKHCLFFPVFISKVLAYLVLEDFLASDSVHLTTPIGSSFLT